jgi:hypothetical protein
MATIKSNALSIIMILLFLSTLNSSATGDLKLNSPDGIHARAVGTKFSAGIFGGVNYSRLYLNHTFFISNSYLPKTDFYFLPTYGLMGMYQPSDQWSFQIEYNIEKKGMHYKAVIYTKVDNMQLKSDIENSLKLSYHTIPFLAKFHFGRVVKMYIEGGPYYSSLRNVKEIGVLKYEQPSQFEPGKIQTVTEDFDWEQTESYSNDFGVIGGAGIIVPLVTGVWGPTTSFILNVRYNRGFRDIYVGRELEAQNDVEEIIGINEDLLDPAEGSNDIRNSVVTLRFGLVFAI